MNPIDQALRCLHDAREHWDQAKEYYFEPDRFRMNVNACIQSLRSVTFLLQNNKSSIDGFDEWYEKWQAIMKADKKLKWLVDARNKIVKQGDLNLKSYQRVSVVGSYLESEVPKFQIEPKPGLTLSHIHKSIRDSGLPEQILADAYVKLERRWVEKECPEAELLEVLTHCWVLLYKLLMDSPSLEGRARESASELESPPPCMENGLDSLVQYYKYTPKSLVNGNILQSSKAVSFNKKVLNKYKDSPLYTRTAEPENFAQLCDLFFEQAKFVLSKDGHHIFLVVFLSDNVPIQFTELQPADQSDKYRMMRDVAETARKLHANGIITISEAWTASQSMDEPIKAARYHKNKRESLILAAATKKGDKRVLSTIFEKQGLLKKKIAYQSTQELDLENVNILEPVREMWINAS